MGEGLSKVTFNLLNFDNPSLFPFRAFRENKRIYNYFFNKYVFSSRKVYLCRPIQLFKPQLLLHYTQTNTVKRNNSNKKPYESLPSICFPKYLHHIVL